MASIWATRPPIDVPYTAARSTPSSSNTAAASSANDAVRPLAGADVCHPSRGSRT